MLRVWRNFKPTLAFLFYWATLHCFSDKFSNNYFAICGQSYKAPTSVNYDSLVIKISKLLSFTILGS